MRHRATVAAGLAAIVIGAAGCGGAGDEDKIGNIDGDPDAKGTLRVWLQVDAQTGWESVVTDATKRFNKKFPKVKVKVDYQQWSDHLTKLDAALGGSQPPDVVEMGNTETTSYIVNGAFADLTEYQDKFEDSKSWNPGLEASCTADGKLYCVPYYAGSRVVIYRKDMFAKVGVTEPPKSYAELTAVADKLMAEYGKKDRRYSAFYMPGKYWFAALTYVHDAGGGIADGKDGAWRGKLDSPQSVQGLERWNELVGKYSRADKTSDESDPQQYTVFGQGKAGMMYGLGWEASLAASKEGGGNPKLEGKIGVFPMPSPSGNGVMQSFTGGSDLAIPAKSKNKTWAVAWTKEMAGLKAQEGLMAANNVPNNTALLDKALSDPELAPFAASAENSWFVPVAEHWSKVEQSLVLKNTLSEIVTGQTSVNQGAKKMNDQVEKTLNGG
ncbi:MAG: extracellular solute-binding protein [Micromonosporaceae bacterium]|nr:extracellular solute-binding protein [Micromonosporaceae bacterium]